MKIILIIGVFISSNLLSQDNTTSAGTDISSSTGSVSFSIGQVFYETKMGGGGNVSQGVQQPMVSNSTGIEEKKNQSFSIFPNPTNSDLTVLLHLKNNEKTTYSIYSIDGTIVKSGTINGTQLKLNLSELSPSIYFFKVYLNNKTIKSKTFIKS